MFVYKWPADKENDTGIVGQHSSCDVQGELDLGPCSVLALQAQTVVPCCLLLGGAHLRQEFKRRGWALWTWEGLWGTLCPKTEGLGSRWKPWGLMTQDRSLRYR